MAFKFEKLTVWQKALDLSASIDNLTRKFPKDERFILTSQIKRAIDSVVLNIAEGSTGQTHSEFKRFLGYSIRSGIEVVSCLFLARKRQLINDQEFYHYYNEMETLIKMITSLKNKIQ